IDRRSSGQLLLHHGEPLDPAHPLLAPGRESRDRRAGDGRPAVHPGGDQAAFPPALPAPRSRRRDRRAGAGAEGWIAGIILTSHTIWQGLVRGIIEAKRDGGPLFDFLAHEVFDNQDPDVRTFLRESSILSRLSATTCNAVLERSDSAARLK